MSKDVTSSYDSEQHILVVDDETSLLKFFKIHLNKFFQDVQVVKNGKDALAHIKKNPTDLVISDIRMPKLGGIDLLEKVRKFDATIPVLLISGAILDKEQIQGLENASGFLKKPFSVEDLHDFIQVGLVKRKVIGEVRELAGGTKKLSAIIRGEASPAKKLSQDEAESIHQAVAEFLKKDEAFQAAS